MFKFNKKEFRAKSVNIHWLLISLVVFCIILAGCVVPPTVIDGDTIVIDGGQVIRYLGIDAPEKDEPFYIEAKTYNYILITGKRLIIEKDVTERDSYGRLLRYIFADGIFVNAELVRKGYALVYNKNKFPDDKYYDILQKAVKEAVKQKLGIWSLPLPHPKLVKNNGNYYIPETD